MKAGGRIAGDAAEGALHMLIYGAVPMRVDREPIAVVGKSAISQRDILQVSHTHEG